jgi:asparagine synthase (glutamine-hydrolysing)
MCGITGIWAFNEVGRFNLVNLEKATLSMAHRGPDNHGTYNDHFVGLGHRRLSIMDTSSKGNQPFEIMAGRYVISFNGEIYNFQALRKELIDKGVQFKSETDTEVLLHLYAQEGSNCLKKLNGFFAFAIYDTQEKKLFVARDRMGIKPLLYFQDEFKFIFGSELQSILAYGIDKEIDQTALSSYLQLNYVPAPSTMVKGVKKLLPGHFIEVINGQVTIEKYYELPQKNKINTNLSYDQAQLKLRELMDESVQHRMISDVPLGCFLSGGVDSSVITAIASNHTDSLSTFSVGFKDAKFLDETKYAEAVAKKFKTNHTTFILTNDDILAELTNIVQHLDEPFADASAIPVYMLSKRTKEQVTVALSGDGADEIFSGYNKHSAWWKIENDLKFKKLISLIHPIAQIMPKTRTGRLSNYMRQIVRFAEASQLSPSDRYWFLASFASEKQAYAMMKDSHFSLGIKSAGLDHLDDDARLNDMLRADTQFVLPNDMLKKVDLMSMANALEVRVPFLDHHVLDFVFKLPESMKINADMRKRILQDAYREVLPKEIYQRPKKGFEMPLLDWLKTALKGELDKQLFDKEKIIAQGIFEWKEIEMLRKQLFSFNPADSPARVWGLFVFQEWFSKYFNDENR